MKTFVVSDIHGRFDALMRALEHSKYSDSDRLIVLGDNIDRGIDSRKVMDFLSQLKNKDNCFLKGNHEDWILEMLAGRSHKAYLWLTEGEGLTTLNSYGRLHHRIRFHGMNVSFEDRYSKTGVSKELPLKDVKIKQFIKMVFPPEHLAFMQAMLDYYEEGDYFFSHAGIQTGLPLAQQKRDSLIHGDEAFIRSDTTDYGKVLIYGHWHSPRQGFHVKKNRICVALASEQIGVLNLTDLIYTDSDSNSRQIGLNDIMK